MGAEMSVFEEGELEDDINAIHNQVDTDDKGYWSLFRAGYDDLVNTIIKPSRASYCMNALGHVEFSLHGSIFVRHDVDIVNARNVPLKCSHWKPRDASKKLPCVLYIHGISSCRVDALPLLPHILSRNMSLFALDLSGSGMSGGEYVSLGYHEREDVAAAVDYLSSLECVSSIGLWGKSFGAVAALLYLDMTASVVTFPVLFTQKNTGLQLTDVNGVATVDSIVTTACWDADSSASAMPGDTLVCVGSVVVRGWSASRVQTCLDQFPSRPIRVVFERERLTTPLPNRLGTTPPSSSSPSSSSSNFASSASMSSSPARFARWLLRSESKKEPVSKDGTPPFSKTSRGGEAEEKDAISTGRVPAPVPGTLMPPSLRTRLSTQQSESSYFAPQPSTGASAWGENGTDTGTGGGGDVTAPGTARKRQGKSVWRLKVTRKSEASARDLATPPPTTGGQGKTDSITSTSFDSMSRSSTESTQPPGHAVGCVVLDSALGDSQALLREMVVKSKQEGLRIPSMLLSLGVSMVAGSVKKVIGYDLRQLRPVRCVGGITVPALMFASEKDEFIPPHHTYALAKSYAGPCRVRMFHGGHDSPRPVAMMGAGADFALETLCPGDGGVGDEAGQRAGRGSMAAAPAPDLGVVGGDSDTRRNSNSSRRSSRGSKMLRAISGMKNSKASPTTPDDTRTPSISSYPSSSLSLPSQEESFSCSSPYAGCLLSTDEVSDRLSLSPLGFVAPDAGAVPPDGPDDSGGAGATPPEWSSILSTTTSAYPTPRSPSSSSSSSSASLPDRDGGFEVISLSVDGFEKVQSPRGSYTGYRVVVEWCLPDGTTTRAPPTTKATDTAATASGQTGHKPSEDAMVYDVFRRFSDFKLLHDVVRGLIRGTRSSGSPKAKSLDDKENQLSAVKLPSFPSGGLATFSSRFDSERLQQRQRAFNALLQVIVMHPVLLDCPQVRGFITIT